MGKFEEGQSKPVGSGRKKGTPNKKTQHLDEVLNAIGLSVPERLMKLLPQLAPEKQADVLIDLMGYLYPKRKAIEQTNINAEFRDVEALSPEEFRGVQAAVFKRANGFDIGDEEKRQAKVSRYLKLLNTMESQKKFELPK